MAENELNKIKNYITDRVILLSVIFLIFPLISSLCRWFEIGWQNIYIIHIVLYILTLIIFFTRKIIPMKIKILLLVLLYSIIGFSGLRFYAFSGVYFFLVISIALTSILIDKKTGIVVLISIMTIFFFIAWSYVSGRYVSTVDFNDFSKSIYQWITLSVSFIAFIFIFIMGFRKFYTELIHSIEEKAAIGNRLEQQNQELINLQKTADESHERFRKLIKHMPNGIATYRAINDGEDFVFIDVNKEAERIINATKEQLIGHSLLEVFSETNTGPVLKCLQTVYKSGKDIYIEPFFYKDKFQEGWRENHIYKLQSGEIVVVFKDVTDITKAKSKLKLQNQELQSAKEKLEESENRLLTFINSIPDIVCYKDGKGKWLLANDADLELFSLKGVDYVGKTDAELAKYTNDIYKNSFETCIQSDEIAWKSKVMSNAIEMIPLPNSHEKKVYDVYKIPLFYPNGKRKGLAVIGRDITQIKNTEKELIKAKELAERSDRLKTAFLNNMSHEIRTPMNGIIGFSKILAHSDKSESERNNYADIIIQSSQQLLQLVNDILDIAKIEANEVVIREKEIDLDAFCKETISLYQIEADKKNIDLKVIKSGLKDNHFMIDSSKLKQVLNNLINNALKFTEKGSIELSCKTEDNKIIFSVKDTGIGIKKELQKSIFDRFRQVESEDDKSYGGTGLGLAICKGLVEKMNGKIWVESELNIGSTFKVLLPYKAISSNKNTIIDMKNEEKHDLNKIKIMVAEDENINFLYISELLSSLHATIIHVINGQEAVDYVQNNQDIDLILMDIKMPIMNGYQASTIIKSISPQLPIIALTAHAFSEDRDKAFKAGCDDFLSKPIDEPTLFNCIKKHLGNNLKFND